MVVQVRYRGSMSCAKIENGRTLLWQQLRWFVSRSEQACSKFGAIWIPPSVLNTTEFTQGFTSDCNTRICVHCPNISAFKQNGIGQGSNSSMLGQMTTSFPWRLGEFLTNCFDFRLDLIYILLPHGRTLKRIDTSSDTDF